MTRKAGFTALVGDSWTARTARRILPILVDLARRERRFTYGQLEAEDRRRSGTRKTMALAYRHPLGTVGRACAEYADAIGRAVPPINALVHNEATQEPGSGVDQFIRDYAASALAHRPDRSRLRQAERQAILHEVYRRVFQFARWEQMLAAFGLPVLPSPVPSRFRRTWRTPRVYQANWSNEGEGPEHAALKTFVQSHPELLGLRSGSHGLTEHCLPSGDRLDVFFAKDAVAVEVKARNAVEGDLHRGIFQCVKYNAVLRATQKSEGSIPSAKCFLVLEWTLPKALRELAQLLDVVVVENIQPRSD